MTILALLIGYEDFDQFVNEVVIDALDMYAEGRADLHDINSGFKTKKMKDVQTFMTLTLDLRQRSRGRKNGQRFRNDKPVS